MKLNKTAKKVLTWRILSFTVSFLLSIPIFETYSQSIVIMRLDTIRKNGTFRITKVNSDNESVAQLMAMGLLPGQEIRLTHEAPLGDPIAVFFRDFRRLVQADRLIKMQIKHTNKPVFFI